MRNHEKPDDPDVHSLDLLASSTSTFGRLLPFTNATFWFGERPLVGGSSHWDAGSKSHVYNIRERQQRVGSGRSDQSAGLKGI